MTDQQPFIDNAEAITLKPVEMAVVTIIRRDGPTSRTELAAELNLSRANITGVITGLLKMGILKEVGPGVSQGGRRPVLLDINNRFGYVIGVDMGATSIDLALADFSGEIISRADEPADVRENPEQMLQHLCEVMLTLIEEQGISPHHVVGIGIGVPGPVSFTEGVLIAPPLMPGWEGYPIRDFVHRSFPIAQVVVDNDVNIMANGELHAGAGKGIDNFLFIKIGTGIGCGIITHGKIYRGSDGCAGDVGHICIDYNGPVCHCGNSGCLEAMAAGPAIVARAEELALAGKSDFLTQRMAEANHQLTVKDVGEAAAMGDRAAISIIRESGRMTGGMLAGLVNFFNPRMILIGGGVSKIGNKLLSSIRQAVLRRSTALSTTDLRIDYAQLGSDAGVVGAIQLAIENVLVVRKK